MVPAAPRLPNAVIPPSESTMAPAAQRLPNELLTRVFEFAVALLPARSICLRALYDYPSRIDHHSNLLSACSLSRSIYLKSYSLWGECNFRSLAAFPGDRAGDRDYCNTRMAWLYFSNNLEKDVFVMDPFSMKTFLVQLMDPGILLFPEDNGSSHGGCVVARCIVSMLSF